MNITLLDSAAMADINKLDLKTNLLRKCAKPEISDAAGNAVTIKGEVNNLTGDRVMFDRKHIQLVNAKLPITVTYALSGREKIDSLLVSTFTIYGGDYGYGRYEIYLGNERKSLYEKENYIAEFDRRGKFDKADITKYAAQIFTLEKSAKAKYFGIKFTHGSAVDDFIRLDMVGAFTRGASEQMAKIKKHGAAVTEYAKIKAENDIQIYDFEKPIYVDKLLVNDVNIPISYKCEDRVNTFKNTILEPTAEGYLVKLEKPVLIDSLSSLQGNIIAAFSGQINVKIFKEDIINPFFLGAGVNVLPTALMKESIANGYSKDFFKYERDAIRTLRPSVARVWFQNDWFQTAPDEYDFELPKFKQFLEYMEVFKETDTDIELDFSFTVGSAIQPWFSIPEVKDKGRSAPRDLKQFARSVVACLKFLSDRGYPVKYITLSNEPNLINFAVNSDMQGKKEYYAKALLNIDAELKKANMREKFEIWGPECAAADPSLCWFKDMYSLAGDCIDRYTKHNYDSFYNEYETVIAPWYKGDSNGRVCITEFGTPTPNFNKSNIGTLIASANCGFDTALEWCLTNSFLPDPLNFKFDEDICLFKNYNFENKLDIMPVCNEYGPAMRYIKKHSKVIKTWCDNDLDVHTAVFEKDGDYTIIVETNSSGNRKLKIDLSGLADKPFRRMVYNIGKMEKPCDFLPKFSSDIITGDFICEDLEVEHCMYLYTTIKD